jgi:DNA helicase-2/ATP-dependent DNA helicase PcrA
MFQPSKYQTDIFDFIATGTGDAVVDAVPGSGKTTTCVEASKRLKTRSALFCAFNKHIADELKTRLEGMSARTIHSVGMSSLRPLGRPEVDGKKYSKLVREYLIDSGITEQEKLTTASSRIRDLLRLAQLTLADAEDESALRDIADRFDLDRADWALTWKAIAPILNRGMELAPEVIDYNDMVWLPHVLSLAPRKVDWVFVDEAQDLNRAQLELVMKARANGGRMLFVGDKRQAIYGFTGADTRSIPNIIDRTQATVLPLSICYRCPTSVIELANEVYPGIEPRPGAPKGKVRHIGEEDILKTVKDGDLIICRTNAPLATLCFELIRAGIPARIRGTDISKNLISILNYVESKPGFQFSRLNPFLGGYLEEQRQLRRGQSQDDIEMVMANILDRIETIQAIYESSRARTMEDLKRSISDLFSDKRAKVWLSSIHKAKGLESNRVILLYPHLLPHPNAKKPWEKEQEWNLKYVALTRAMAELIFAHGDEED